MDPFASALEQAAAVRRKDIRPRELVEMYLQRIERLNPGLNHYWEVTAAEALALADEAERAADGGGVLNGVPMSIKAQVALAGHPWTLGAFQMKDFMPPEESFVVKRYRQERMPILGITTMSEFGSRPITE